uniref:Late embryogenesis abundant protein LEA-2 subgroup domain-containing protein n=1 Tax=Cajanus cajan TaxID=3821 RepID=A0A151R225_CAJCA|nr:hypothetical protein KK1_042376 [Cajanus cajan]
MPILRLSFNIICTLIICLLLIVLITDVIVLWIVIKPRFPFFKLNTVTVNNLNSTTNAELTASFDVTVNSRNPNPTLSISYESLEVVVWFDNHTIASAFVAPPWQEPEREVSVRTRFGVNRKVVPRHVVDGIAAQRASGSVRFGVTLRARVRFWWHGLVCTRVRSFNVGCYPLNVAFPTDGNSSNIGRLIVPADCYVP